MVLAVNKNFDASILSPSSCLIIVSHRLGVGIAEHADLLAVYIAIGKKVVGNGCRTSRG